MKGAEHGVPFDSVTLGTAAAGGAGGRAGGAVGFGRRLKPPPSGFAEHQAVSVRCERKAGDGAQEAGAEFGAEFGLSCVRREPSVGPWGGGGGRPLEALGGWEIREVRGKPGEGHDWKHEGARGSGTGDHMGQTEAGRDAVGGWNIGFSKVTLTRAGGRGGEGVSLPVLMAGGWYIAFG